MDCHVLSSNLKVADEATSFFRPCDIVTSTKKTRHISEVDIMRKNLTEIVFILDRSGSMSGLEADTIGGYNSLIEKQKKEEGEAIVSTVLFDDTQEVLHDRVDLEKMKPITDKEYYVRGCTALLDAVGGAIHHIGNVHKYAREEDRPEKTLFIITTDGMENSSRRYTYDKVKKMVERQKSKYGWEFLFLGANIDAIEVAGRFGIGADRAVNYECDSIGTEVNYKVLSKAVSRVRASALALLWHLERTGKKKLKLIIRKDTEAETVDNRLDKTRKSVEEVAVLSATFRLSKQRIKEIR